MVVSRTTRLACRSWRQSLAESSAALPWPCLSNRVVRNVREWSGPPTEHAHTRRRTPQTRNVKSVNCGCLPVGQRSPKGTRSPQASRQCFAAQSHTPQNVRHNCRGPTWTTSGNLCWTRFNITLSQMTPRVRRSPCQKRGAMRTALPFHLPGKWPGGAVERRSPTPRRPMAVVAANERERQPTAAYQLEMPHVATMTTRLPLRSHHHNG